MGNVQGVVQYSGDGAPKPRPDVKGMCALAVAQTDPLQVCMTSCHVYRSM